MELWLLLSSWCDNRALTLAIKCHDEKTVVRISRAANAMIEPMEVSSDDCSICGEPWESHYEPRYLKFKLGPYGVFGLKPGMHFPHVPSAHAERNV